MGIWSRLDALEFSVGALRVEVDDLERELTMLSGFIGDVGCRGCSNYVFSHSPTGDLVYSHLCCVLKSDEGLTGRVLYCGSISKVIVPDPNCPGKVINEHKPNKS